MKYIKWVNKNINSLENKNIVVKSKPLDTQRIKGYNGEKATATNTE